MPTLGKLIAEVRHRLNGVGNHTPNSMELQTELAEDGLTIRVDDASKQSNGVYEIGLEKIRVKSVDRGANTLTVYGFGRGYEGTEVGVHPAGSEVVRAGAYPNSTLAHEINGVLREFFPYIYGVVTVDMDYAPPFVMPDDCAGIIAVFVSDRAASDGWRRVDRWLWEPDSGQGLKIPAAERGTSVRITYATVPVPFDLGDPYAMEQDWAQTGLPDRLADLMALGAASRLAPFADMGNLFNTGQEARSDASKPPGRGGQLSRLLSAQFQQQLVQEQLVLQKMHPIRVHRER